MSTMTKPRPRARTSMPSMAYEEMVTEMRKRRAVVKRRVTRIKADTEANRSTRDQRAMRAMAQAWIDEDEILAGR